MAFQSKIDFCGLSANDKIVCKSHNEGRSHSTVNCPNDEGDIIDVTVFGKNGKESLHTEYSCAGAITVIGNCLRQLICKLLGVLALGYSVIYSDSQCGGG